MTVSKLAPAAFLSLLLLGCEHSGELVATGVTQIRSACPSVAIPAPTGDITLFNPPSSRDASAIDVVATMTDVRSTCSDSGANIVTGVTFNVFGLRRDPRGVRDVVVPYFATVVQAGTNVVSKSVGRVNLHFADGQLRARSAGSASAQVARSAATLPPDVEREVTRDRKAGEAEAAVDPMSSPKVRSALERATFEVLVGFQLTHDQLAYNATR